MVFSGIEFDMEALRATVSSGDIEHAATRPATDRRAWASELAEEGRRIVPDHYTLNLTAKASFPEDLAGSLTVLVNYLPEEGQSQYLGGALYAAGDIVPVNKRGQQIDTSYIPQPESIGDAQDAAPDSNRFILKKESEKIMMLLEVDLHAEGGRLVATVRYVPEVGVFPQEDYIMELSR